MGFKARGKAKFGPELYGFMIELSINNNRDWFAENKDFYESAAKEPMLDFIAEFAPKLEGISPHFRAEPRSLFRIYRDVRFSKNKSPYKTHVAAHFRHVLGRDVHAPGFYLHIEPGEVFAGGGIWRPDAEGLARIRKRIAEHPEEWKRVVRSKAFNKTYTLQGASLVRPPRGFDPDHECIEDLKRKDFIAVTQFDDADVMKTDFVGRYARACMGMAEFNRFLCKALEVPF